MSDKGSESRQNKGFNAILKWTLLILIALILEAGAIFSSVKITEMRGKTDTAKLQNIYDKLSSQQKQMNLLEKLPSSVSAVNQQLTDNAQNLKILTENLERLNEEAGSRIFDMTAKIEKLQQRVEIVEESSREDTLVLNLALIIKESILYQRLFTQEAELLSDISQNNMAIKTYADIINSYKNQHLKSNEQLAREYVKLAQSFHFSNVNETAVEPEAQGAMAKSVKILKGTVAKLNFDKVIVLKKDKPTEQQQELMNKLKELVESYNYQEALTVLSEHSELKSNDEQEFELWKKDVSSKLEVENALSEIITKQLFSLRQSIKNKTIQIPVTTNENTVDNSLQTSTEETKVEESENNENQAEIEETSDD